MDGSLCIRKQIAGESYRMVFITQKVLSKRTKHIIKNKFVYPIMLWDDTAIFIFSNKKERLFVTGFELYRFIALMDISLDFIKHNN